MSDPSLPAIGSTDWGNALNDYLTWLEARVTAAEQKNAELETRVAALEAAP